jgi:hypothetical protein
MSYHLFLDDERDPPRDDHTWEVVRTFEAATSLISQRGLPDFISFDHDLGENPDGTVRRSGADVAHWIADYVLDNNLKLDRFTWYVHSQNPIGVRNIDEYLKNLVRAVNG